MKKISFVSLVISISTIAAISFYANPASSKDKPIPPPKGPAYVSDAHIRSTTPEQFTYTVTDKALAINFTEVASGRKTKITTEFTIGHDSKFSITPANKPPVEAGIFVLSKGNTIQNVQIFVPSTTSKIPSASATKPVCNLENNGDFSWKTPSELNELLRAIPVGGKTELQVLIGKSPTHTVKDLKKDWVKCFSF